MAVCIAANLLKLMVSNSRKKYILGKIHYYDDDTVTYSASK